MKKLWPHKAQSNAVQCVFAKAQSSLIVNTRFWYQHGQTLSTLCFTKLDISMKIQIKQQLENCSLRSCQGSWRKLLKWKQKNLVWNWMKYNSLNEFILDEILWMNFSGFSIVHCFGKNLFKKIVKSWKIHKNVFLSSDTSSLRSRSRRCCAFKWLRLQSDSSTLLLMVKKQRIYTIVSSL